MASKLEYLKKYLVAPGGGSGSADAATAKKSAGGAKPVKEKKKKSSGLGGSMMIRDMSEVLPAAREERRSRGLRDLLAREDPEALNMPGEEPEFVDENLVEEARKATANDISGIKWKIQQHRKPPTRQALKQPVKEELEGDASGSDLDVARPPPKKGGGAPAASRGAIPAAAAGDDDSDLDVARPRGKAPAPRRVSGGSGGGGGGDDSDMSPPRASGGKVKKEEPRVKAEPVAKRESGVKEEPMSDDDISAPRKPTKASGQKARHDSDSDISAPRAGGGGGVTQRHDSDAEDLSPPRKSGGDKGKRKRHDSDDDSDISPPRKGEEEEEEKMSSGLRAGLVSGKALKDEAAKVRAERRAAVEALPDSETGKGATTVYRSKDGTKISREDWIGDQQKKKKKRLSEYPEQDLEWGGGLKQKASREAEMEEVSRIAAQPFARYQPDEKYMEELQQKQDWNDPMKNFQDEEAAAEAKKPLAKAKPKCPHPPWPNRFDILPGYRWDGKVRGNGFEKRWLETKNTRRLDKQKRWMEDMEDQ